MLSMTTHPRSFRVVSTSTPARRCQDRGRLPMKVDGKYLPTAGYLASYLAGVGHPLIRLLYLA